MPQIQGYGRYPYNNMPPQPQYMAPQYGPGLPGQGTWQHDICVHLIS